MHALHPRLEELAQDLPEITAIRHQIHRHPELAFEETATADLVACKLREWGFEVATGVGTTGVVGTLKAGRGSRRIGLRADMDALAIEERTGLPYASVVPGKMHACGHDGHTSILLGAAKYLARTRRFSGTLHLYFQPAEERGHDSGAERMLADGLFERFPCDAVFGLHNHPGVQVGTVMVRKGASQPATDKVAIRVIGKGGHVARPHLTVDPCVAAASIVMALQTIVSRNVDATQTAVLSVCTLQSGGFYGVIPDEARIELSVRCFDPGVRALLRERIEATVYGQAQSYGARAEMLISPWRWPANCWALNVWTRTSAWSRRATTSPSCCSSGPAATCAWATACSASPATRCTIPGTTSMTITSVSGRRTGACWWSATSGMAREPGTAVERLMLLKK
jgi:hippurate hydrolase